MTHHYDGPEPSEDKTPKKEPIGDVLKKYKQMRDEGTLPSPESVTSTPVEKPIEAAPAAIPPPASAFNPQEYENTMSQETDPDLMTSYEIVKLPSKGLFYKNKIKEVNVE